MAGNAMGSVNDVLRSQPFLSGLSEHQFDRLEQWAQRSFFHAGNRLFREGEDADRFWLVIDGEVAVDLHVPGRGDVVVDTLGAGSMLGWSWLFPPYRWHFGAVAIDTTRTLEFDGPGVRQLCERDQGLGFLLALRSAEVLLGRLQATRRRLLASAG